MRVTVDCRHVNIKTHDFLWPAELYVTPCNSDKCHGIPILNLYLC